MTGITLYGFNGSTYVRTVKMLLAEKGVTDIEQIPLNVLTGEPKSPGAPRSATRSAKSPSSSTTA